MRMAKIQDSLQQIRRTGIPICTIVDVGIQHSTPALIQTFPDVPHVLFEPVEEYYPHIREKYAQLDHQLVEAAVSDFDGEVMLHTEKKTRGAEVSHSHITNKKTASSRMVRSVTLDKFFIGNQLPKPYLLKIDVEGANVPASIIRGARWMLQHTSVVVIEMTVDRFMERGLLLHEAGFDLWDIADLCYYGDCLWQADVVFVNRQLKQSTPALRPMHDRPFLPELWQGVKQ